MQAGFGGVAVPPANGPCDSDPVRSSKTPGSAMLQGPWRIEMFGRLRCIGADRVLDRFRTEKTAVLLAYLAYHLDRTHSREELIGLLWPEADTARGQMSLRTAISSLRRQ